MDIATIQKRKFLNNIYRLLYSDGTKPSEAQVRKAFTEYFATNNPGLPLRVDYSKLQNADLVDVDVLNELMITNLFNLEILYDSVYENNQELFSVVTTLNNKLDGLRARRSQLEAKLDQMIFANSNSDGYYYSILDNFSTISDLDMNLTTAFIDLLNGNVTIPKITNVVSDSVVSKDIIGPNITYTASINDKILANNAVATNFDSVLDGLNDTYWSYDIKSDTLGIASLAITIPLDPGYPISKIEGSLLTASPCAVYLSVNPINPTGEEEVRIKDSGENYSRFSFSIPADTYSSITLALVKMEPDRFESRSTGMYVYSFGLRELQVSSAYYDKSAVLVSAPLSIPSEDNTNLAISSVALDVRSQLNPGTALEYYVAADNGATEISSFNWIRVEPTDQGILNSVSLSSSNSRSKIIDTIGGDLTLIPEVIEAEAENDKNPQALPYSEKTVYKVCALDPNEQLIEPSILSGLGVYRHYGIILASSKISTELYKSLDAWRERIGSGINIGIDYLTSQVTSITPGIFGANLGLIETRLMSEKDISVTHTVTKSDPNFNLGIYLNGVMIADIPAGVLTKSIEWNFVRGINNITITYDKDFSGLISFNLMTGRNISEYGTLFLDYFTYLDPIQFRSNRTTQANVFTIDSVFGRREILSQQKIAYRSMLKYYNNQSDLVTAVRYRVNFSRFNNPLQTPVLDAVRLKFKHNDAPLT